MDAQSHRSRAIHCAFLSNLDAVGGEQVK